MSDKPEVITSEVEASEQTVAAVRNEIPVGSSGAPIDRLPLNPQLQQLVASGIYVKRIASTDRCIRVVDLPLKGGATGQFHCSRACVRLGDMQLCPEHDKAAFAPQQTPVARGRVTNSASIELSAGEQSEMAKISKSFGSPLPVPARPEVAVPVASAPLAESGEVVTVRMTLRYLMAVTDIRAAFAQAICSALDDLPAGNVRQMKQIVALQEKVQRMLVAPKGRKRHARVEGQAE